MGMKQVMVSGGGQVEVVEVPVPSVPTDSVLVRNAYSLISRGTEGKLVAKSGGLLGIYEKLRQSPDRVDKVISSVKMTGLANTIDQVYRKLSEQNSVGYSSAGIVVETRGNVNGIRVGDPVACMGVGFANHAEYVALPKNLVASAHGVSLQHAAFGAIGCIGLQGIRRLELTPGEVVGVLGLGLIGEICSRLLVALGYRPIGIDLDPDRVARVRSIPGVAAACVPQDAPLVVEELTSSWGLDGIVICAASSDESVANDALGLCRHRGRVVIVGDVPLRLRRERMYRKELEVRLSCSYGPGRYDDLYELSGIDYPIAFARWTEKRNLELFLELVRSGAVQLDSLISAEYPLDSARDAYLAAKVGHTPYGVLFDYGVESGERAGASPVSATARVVCRTGGVLPSGTVKIALIGAGRYMSAMHAPNLLRLNRLFTISAIASKSGSSAASLARATGSPIVTSDYRVILDDHSIDAVLIGTRHATHERIVLEALGAGKHVFVEKPIALTVTGAALIRESVPETLILRVGFNRRFASAVKAMKEGVNATPKRVLVVRVNVGSIKDHWSMAPEEGGRLLGEGVHFFDLANWLMEMPLDSITAVPIGAPCNANPSASVVLGYTDGSVASIVYTNESSARTGKEWFELIGDRRAVRVDDYRRIQFIGGRRRRIRRGDKGQLEILREFGESILGQAVTVPNGADANAGLLATLVAVGAEKSMREGVSVSADSFEPVAASGAAG